MKKNYNFSFLLIALLSLVVQISVAQTTPIGTSQPGVPDDWKNDLWLNTNFREMSVGSTYQIVARRVPEIIDNPISNNVTLPTFHYTVVRGNSVTVNESGLVTANSLGTSIIEVKYDEKVANETTYGAVSPVNITYMAVDVIDPNVANTVTLTTDITTRTYDTHYFLGETTTLSFNVTMEGADKVTVKCNDYNARQKENNYTVRLLNRANIIEIVALKNNVAVRKLYYVIDARRIEVKVQNITNPGKNFEAGDKAQVSFKGITLPVYKLATIYNPQFESPWGGKFTRVYFDNQQLGEVKSNVDVSQYDLADKNTIEMTLGAEGNYIFKNGRINEAWWGSPLGTDKDMSGPGQPNLNAGTVESNFSTFPNFNISVGYQPALFEEIKLAPQSHRYADVTASAVNETVSESFTSGSFFFKNFATNWGGGILSWYGTGVSNRTDNTSPGGVGNQCNSASGGDVDGTGNYAVIYEANSGGMEDYGLETVTFTNKDYPDGKQIQGMYVTNNTYATSSMKTGDQFAKKFGGKSGNDPDYFKLTVKGYNKNDAETGSVDFYLADFRPENNIKDYILENWRWVDLSSLGTVAKIKFRLTSSDAGAYGMNTPSYFCADNVNAPRLRTVNPIANLTVKSNSTEQTIDMSAVFADAQFPEAVITKSIRYNTNSGLVNAQVEGNLLKLSFTNGQTGTAEICIKAQSAKMDAESTFTVNVTPATGIDKNEIGSLRISPNPAANFITVNTDGKVEIFTANGVKVYENAAYTADTQINVSHLTNGVYIVKVNGKTVKLIKQ